MLWTLHLKQRKVYYVLSTWTALSAQGVFKVSFPHIHAVSFTSLSNCIPHDILLGDLIRHFSIFLMFKIIILLVGCGLFPLATIVLVGRFDILNSGSKNNTYELRSYSKKRRLNNYCNFTLVKQILKFFKQDKSHAKHTSLSLGRHF